MVSVWIKLDQNDEPASWLSIKYGNPKLAHPANDRHGLCSFQGCEWLGICSTRHGTRQLVALNTQMILLKDAW